MGPVVVRGGYGSGLAIHGTAAEVRAQVRGADGAVVPGFSFDDCAPMPLRGRAIVQWCAASSKNEFGPSRSDLVRLDGRAVRIEVRVRDGHVARVEVQPGSERPLRLADGPHLLIDDFLVAEASEVISRPGPVERRVEPAIAGTDDLDVSGGGLTFDESEQNFRLWYWSSAPGIRTRVMHARSADGVKWADSGEVLRLDGYGTKVVDCGADCPDADRRFKLAFFRFAPPPLGVCVMFSPDGLRWREYEGNPVLPFYPRGHRLWPRGVGDIVDPFWDPIRHRFGALVKLFCKSSSEFHLQSRTMRPGEGIRLLGQTASEDFVAWEEPWRICVPDEQDEGVTEFYGGAVLARGDLLVAFLRILRDDLPADASGPVQGIGYTVLATSRDGRTWERRREPFLDRSPVAGAYDHAFAWVTGAALRGDTVHLAYAAYDRGHKGGRRACGMATVKRDRFLARESRPGTRGRIRTRLLLHTGRRLEGLWLNADASSGRIRVQVLDAAGRPVPGLSLDDCRSAAGDALQMRVEFRRPLAELSGQPFRLEFELERARLYGFSFASQ